MRTVVAPTKLAVRQVISKIQGNYNVPKIPALLHLVLIGNFQYKSLQPQITHLDELVDALYMEDRQSGQAIFKSEIEVLDSVIKILKGLQDLFTRAGVDVFPYVLSSELYQAVIEEAA
jgi:hypothetical protein